MGTLLLKNASMLVTMDDERRTIADGAIFAGDNVIEMVGATSDLPAGADRVIDATGMVVLPGLINTHHHLYQTLTRALPAVENANLFDWLTYLYPIWAELTAEAVYHSALVGLAELLLSGCTTPKHVYPRTIPLAVAEGAQFLVTSQNTDGSWGSGRETTSFSVLAAVPGSHDAFRVATTALCVMALL